MIAKPLRKPPGKRHNSDSGAKPDRGALPQERDQRPGLPQEKKDQRIALFLSDFDQQDKEHVQEHVQLDSPLQTAEKAFTVELLGMPAASRKMKRKDLLDFQNQATGFTGVWFKWQTEPSFRVQPALVGMDYALLGELLHHEDLQQLLKQIQENGQKTLIMVQHDVGKIHHIIKRVKEDRKNY